MRPEHFILNDKGEPEVCEDLLTWARWMEDRSRRRIAQDKDEGPDGLEIWVSTVFLGLDHNWGETGAPVLFETMVFGGVLDGEQERYTTRDDAFRGHQEMCRRVSATLVPRDPKVDIT